MIKYILKLLGFGKKTAKDKATSELIKTWLKPKDFEAMSITATYKHLLSLYKLCDRGKVQAHVKGLDYPEFLNTPYWRVFSKFMKKDASCDKCKSERQLELHHKTYKHIGLDDMQVLCKTCHIKQHSK
jgi:hypothetical protein